jgi:pSer/pThr/pTyr-binding forkhead associated (FHA) protein
VNERKEDELVDNRTTIEIDCAGTVGQGEVAAKRVSIVFYGPQNPVVVNLFSPGEVVVVGRQHPSDITISDPSLSRQHARLCWDG